MILRLSLLNKAFFEIEKLPLLRRSSKNKLTLLILAKIISYVKSSLLIMRFYIYGKKRLL